MRVQREPESNWSSTAAVEAVNLTGQEYLSFTGPPVQTTNTTVVFTLSWPQETVFFLISKDAYNVLSLRPYNIILNIHKDICIYFGAYLISIQYLRREAECLQDLQAIQTFKKAIILSLNTAWLRGGKQYNYCLNMMDE